MKESIKEFVALYGLSILSGAVLVLAFAPWQLYPIAWFAFIPFLLSLYTMTPNQGFKAGLFFGLPYFFGTQYWIYHSMNHYGGLPLLPSFFVVFILALYLSLYPAIFGFLFARRIVKTRLPALIIAPVFWTSLEFIRSYALTGFPWSSLGYSQYTFLHAIQFADITGVYGVSFLVVAVNSAVADMFILKNKKLRMPLFPSWPTAAAIASLSIALCMVFAYGYYRLGESRDGRGVRASLIQGNIEQNMKWDERFQEDVIKTYFNMTSEARASSPDIIIWPETAVPFLFGADKTKSARLMSFQRTLETYLLFGAITVKPPESEESGKSELANSAVLLNTDGSLGYVYDKIHLVPFGEYVPLKRLFFFLDKMVVGIGDYYSGQNYGRADSLAGSFATIICYESIFPGLVRKFFVKGGDYLVIITNDAWFGTTAGPYQHFSMAVFRAIENRKPVLRAANSGISSLIDSSGRIVAKTALFERKVLTVDFNADNTKTVYTGYGDIFSFCCIILSAFLLLNLNKSKDN